MTRIATCELPDNGLTKTYLAKGAHTDCYYIDIAAKVTLAQYLQAFYNTPVFSVEKTLLTTFAKKHIRNNDINVLADGNCDSFSIWTVEQRTDNQILLCEFTQSTRSWLMVDYLGTAEQPITRLYFGSVVVPKIVSPSGKSTFGILFYAFAGFHKLYSRALLKSAFNALRKNNS